MFFKSSFNRMTSFANAMKAFGLIFGREKKLKNFGEEQADCFDRVFTMNLSYPIYNVIDANR